MFRLTKTDSITVNRDPTTDIVLSNKKSVDDTLGEGTVLRFSQTL